MTLRRSDSARVLALLLLAAAACADARAQLLGEPALPPKVKREKTRREDLEWMWQYGPPPAGGRENDLIQDPHFRPMLDQYFRAPQSFWGPQTERGRKSLADTAFDFLAIPGAVSAEENRYVSVTGHVFHLPTSRGLLWADLNSPHPLVVFAAIDWIRDGHTTDEAAAEYTVWIFPNRVAAADQPSGAPATSRLPPALVRSLARWMRDPLPGSGLVQHVTAAVLVEPDGTPQQIPIPRESTP